MIDSAAPGTFGIYCATYMGDLRDWSREDNGFHLEERPPSSSSSSSSSCCDAIGGESWRRAEEVTQGIIAKIQPNSASEERRRAVIDYVQRLLRGYLRCEVLPYGSVPLKTYLPDGDIDLTAFGGTVSEDAFATEVMSVLEREDHNGFAEFTVKDVQYIRAEVKLVKCIVQNIVVDISFNQLGGLSTLCFLEKVDRLIGKRNLFKQSIILIKAWCYYESRILGAHHGLISTYALETMVLYIFHIFHSSLDGPLAVLYKFLDYYSKFDWEKYCVSLKGPVTISSLPEFTVDTSDKSGAVEPLLSNEFLRECAEMFSPPSKALGPSARTFQLKHLNIVDPLKESNNLGRSVSKGNLARIRSAFALGARKLEKILSQPDDNLTDETRTFFTSTLDRHGSGERPDIQYNVLNYGYNNGFVFNLPSPYPEFPKDDQYSGSQSGNAVTLDEPPSYRRTPPHGLSSEEVNMSSGFTAEQSSVLSAKLKEVDTFEQNLEKSNEASGSEGGSMFSQSNHFPNLDITKDAELIDGDSEREHSENSGDADVSSSSSQMSVGLLPDEPKLHTSQLSRLSLSAEDFVPSRHHHGLWGSRTPDLTKSLPDLDGDYENQLSSLQFGRRWFDYAMGAAPVPPVPPTFVPQYQKQNHYPRMSPKAGPPLMPGFYHRSSPGASFGGEDMHKTRGTGTYFPKMNHYKDRHLTGRGRHQAPARSPSPRYNGPAMTFPHATFSDRNDQEPLQVRGRSTASSDSPNGTIHSSEEISQFGTEGSKQPISIAEPRPSNSPRPVSQSPKPTSETNKNRLIPIQSYHLKDEDDFPPLSV